MPKDKKNPDAPVVRSDAPLGAEEVDEKMAEEQEKGYQGEVPDPTPNENYTVAGVTAGAPTPETDAGLEKDARANVGIGAGPIESAQVEAEKE